MRRILHIAGRRRFAAQTVAAAIRLRFRALALRADLAEGDVDVLAADTAGPIASCIRTCDMLDGGEVRPCRGDELAYANRWNRLMAWQLAGRAHVKMQRVVGAPACVVVRNWDHE